MRKLAFAMEVCMSEQNERMVIFPVSGGIFGVGRLATRLTELAASHQSVSGTLATGWTGSTPQSGSTSIPSRMPRSPNPPATAQRPRRPDGKIKTSAEHGCTMQSNHQRVAQRMAGLVRTQCQ